MSIFAPTVTGGTFDPTSVKAISVYHDGDFLNLDMRVRDFDVTCVPVSELGRRWAGCFRRCRLELAPCPFDEGLTVTGCIGEGSRPVRFR
jgi:hypothetical protein